MKHKTNAMRILDSLNIPYGEYDYTNTDAISGIEVATVTGQNPAKVFKTLVTFGKTGTYYVFMIPVEAELDLKKAATFVNEKSIEMLKAKDLLTATGYVHGGCSPIGMKKPFYPISSGRLPHLVWASWGKPSSQSNPLVVKLFIT